MKTKMSRFLIRFLSLALMASTFHFGTASADVLGSVWYEQEVSGWKGVWTRRGNSNEFDARFTHPSGQTTGGRLRINVNGRNISINRWNPGTSGRCSYRGTFSSDFSTASGAYACTRQDGSWMPTYRWQATITGQNIQQGQDPGQGSGSGRNRQQSCFQKHANRLLPGHNITNDGLRANLNRCLDKCRSNSECKGVDYNLETRKCFFQTKDKTEVALEPSDIYDHYHNVCQSQTGVNQQLARCFTLFSGSAIPGHNVKVLTTSLSQCGQECQKYEWCRSFDYDTGGRKCYLQDVDRVAYGGLHRDSKYDHYQRECY